MRQKLNILLLVLVGLIVTGSSACKKEEEQTVRREALLLWEGEVALDGCGFFLEVSGTRFKPINEDIIPEAFKANDTTEVIAEYQHEKDLYTFACGFAQQQYEAVNLFSVVEK